ncbi:MAG TPA: LuxR C-terminal-related transcriptional regulator [Phycisphaerales bacterium]|nr:LuxR C-terminal-related transcriptional regulator [Phycisphaerales bacterium]
MANTTISFDWSVVAADGGLCALVVDGQGRVLSMNGVAATIFARRPAREAVGLRIGDFLPAPAAAERMEFIRQVIATGEALVVRELWGGIALRCTLRRVDEGEGAGTSVLIVGTPEQALLDEPSEGTSRTVEAKQVDFGPLSGLTASELKVMALIGEGLSNAEIAARLHRAVKTVESHRAALTEKTGSSSRVQLGMMARRAGLMRRLGPLIASNGDAVRQPV